jgi:hypothetical protein
MGRKLPVLWRGVGPEANLFHADLLAALGLPRGGDS